MNFNGWWMRYPYIIRRDVSISIEQGPYGSPTQSAYVIPRGQVLGYGGSFITVEERQMLK